MGLFDFLKPKKEEYKKPTEKEILENLADFNERNGDWRSAFYFRNKGIIDLYDAEICNCLKAASEAPDDAHALQYLHEAINQYDSFRSWCSANPQGEEYFDSFDRTGPEKVSRYERILADIKSREYRLSVVDTILDKASDGILQSELIKMFDLYPSDVRLMIQRLEEEGKIVKEKSGRSYIIRKK